MLLTALKYVLKVFHPLVLLAIACLVAAYWIANYPDLLKFGELAPFTDTARNFWIVLVLVMLGILFVFMAAVRVHFWFTDTVLPAWREKRARQQQKTEMRERSVAAPDRSVQELDALDAMMEIVFGILKKRWRMTGNGLYGLPWYLVIGASQSGKSELIASGDSRFSVDHDIATACASYSDMLSYSLLSWRVAGNEAVVLELDGAWLNPDQDEHELRELIWTRFLENMLKFRGRQPITGVVAVVDIAEALRQPQNGRDVLAQELRRHIAAAATVFDTPMTLNVVFTQIDRLSGFSEMFSGLTPEQRAELAMLMVPLYFSDGKDWESELEVAYSHLADRLSFFLRNALVQMPSPYARQEAISFVHSFAGMRALLMAFLRAAFGDDKFTKMPKLRGIAFASTRQENDVHSPMLSEIAAHYGLQAPIYPVQKALSVPFFTERLWQRFVFSQAGVAGVSNNERRAHGRRFAAVLILCIACVGAITSYWYGRYNTQVALAEQVARDAQRFSNLSQTDVVDPTGEAYAEALNVIGATTQDLGEYWNRTVLRALVTLDRGKEIGSLSDKLYRDQLNNVFVPALMTGVGDALVDSCLRGTNRQLQALNVYRMLGEVQEREPHQIEKYFRNLWRGTFPAEAGLQQALLGHLSFALKSAPVVYKTDNELITNAQTDLRSLSPHIRVFLEVRSLAERQLPNPLTFTGQIGTNFDRVYFATGEAESLVDLSGQQGECPSLQIEDNAVVDPFEIPRLYTRNGYRDFFVDQLDDVANVAARDLWTLGLVETADYSDDDYDAIRDRLRQTLVEQYVRVWRQALGATSIHSFDSLREGVIITEALSSLDSPLRRLAELTRDQTTIYEPRSVSQNDQSLVETVFSFDANREAGLRINHAFREIHEMLDTEVETNRPNIEEILTAVAALSDYLKSIQDAPSPPVRALELAKMRVQLTGDDPIYTLRQIARRTPAPFDAHLESLADEVWRVILVEVARELNRLWQDEVYAFYSERLSGRYPLVRSAQIDASLQDFETFFAPEGILRKFYDQELAIFVDQSSGRPRSIDGQALPVDPAFASNLGKALEVAPTFFGVDGQLRIEYVVSPLGMSNSLSRAVLSFEGQLIINAHRAARGVQIIWPNLLGAPEMSRFDLSAVGARQQSYGKGYTGPWSWLKLYDQAQKAGISGNSVDVILLDAAGRDAHYRFSAAGTVNPFFNSPFDGFDLPHAMIGDDQEILQ